MDKKKVGIVTFHTADNYGAVLQAYALQTYIANMGFDVKIIDFNTPSHEKEHNIFKKAPDPLRTVYYGFFTVLRYFSLKKKINRFAQFRSSFLNLTKHKYSSEQDFLSNMEYFDYYISGSDQVFNPFVKYSDCYYLGFDKGKGEKIAYAASFGVTEFSNEQVLRIRKFVDDFKVLSCREKVGSDFLSQLTGRCVPNVCDPVFLLSKSEWKKIIPNFKKDHKYIFIYSLNGEPDLVQLAREVSVANGNIEIICASRQTRTSYKGVTIVRSLGPLQLLSYIANAEYVVTDSFHGTSLSLILGSKVLCYISMKHTASRIESLAETIGVKNQIIYDIKSFNWSEIEFTDYKSKLVEFSSFSKKFIQETLL